MDGWLKDWVGSVEAAVRRNGSGGSRAEYVAMELRSQTIAGSNAVVLYNHTLSVDIVDYVMRRLSEKKPRRQVERELEALGAVIKRREKPRFVST